MKLAAVIALALGLSACATFEVGETYEFVGEIEMVFDLVNDPIKSKTLLMTDQGKIEFYGHCKNANIKDKVRVELLSDMVVVDNNHKFWTLKKCVPMTASI